MRSKTAVLGVVVVEVAEAVQEVEEVQGLHLKVRERAAGEKKPYS